MSRSAAGKTAMAGDVYAGSETAARLADYSGAQYIYISGRSTVAAELTPESAAALSDVTLPPVSGETHGVDSGSEKETTTSKEHKSDHPGRDPAKVSLL